MSEEEEEKQARFLGLLLLLANRYEKEAIRQTRQTFLETMRDLRRLVQRMEPSGPFRQYEWGRLQREVSEILDPLNANLSRNLLEQMEAIEAPAQTMAQNYADIEQEEPIKRSQTQLLETNVAGLPLIAWIAAGGRLIRNLQDDFTRTVEVGLIRGDTTQIIANKVLQLTTRNGKIVPIVQTGSFANRAATQINNTVTGAVWGGVNDDLRIAWRSTSPRAWIWNAVLDARTCPICTPLHGQIVPRPTSFVMTGYSRTMPPVHFNCRCSIIPVFT